MRAIFILHKKPKENKKEEKVETSDNVQPIVQPEEVVAEPTVQTEQETVEQPITQPEQEVIEQPTIQQETVEETVEEVQPQEPVAEQATENQAAAPEIEEVNESLFHKPEEHNNGDSPWEV